MDQYRTEQVDGDEPPVGVRLDAGGNQDGADGAGGASLLSDHFPEVLRGDAQLQHDHLLAAHRLHAHLVRNVNQAMSNSLNQCSYVLIRVSTSPCLPVAGLLRGWLLSSEGGTSIVSHPLSSRSAWVADFRLRRVRSLL